ncbi:hypothetical protein MFS40622_0131 [Methanocaldococcus sp. FS406-22]|uniref:hypothetical protein n=1 Tax=Methanocaldococcus sp. (strain FS406-22) TaxID=644281 RepID=UPI0001BF579E|nr:hypothetical protein [Methanocaldococcus sp. FS406-22]ADC68831.1 hypothetical protein MFS40622_0131 [Methanocaldococcus sp. FS406-22]
MDYITLINYIKRNYSSKFLTDSQKEAYNKLKKFLLFDNVVNLYGKSGVGKTFLGWVFAKDNNFIYFKTEEEFKKYKTTRKMNVIIDNGELNDGRNIRRLISLKANKAIYISKGETLDYSVKLTLNWRDVEHVLENISPIIEKNKNIYIDNFFDSDLNLWKVFKVMTYGY